MGRQQRHSTRIENSQNVSHDLEMRIILLSFALRRHSEIIEKSLQNDNKNKSENCKQNTLLASLDSRK